MENRRNFAPKAATAARRECLKNVKNHASTIAQTVVECAKKAAFYTNNLHRWIKCSYFATEFFGLRIIINTLKIKIMSEIESKVKAIIVDKLGVDEAEVKPEASFTNDLGADSLDTVELIMEFEKNFGVSIPDDKSEQIATVGDAIKYIEENAK